MLRGRSRRARGCAYRSRPCSDLRRWQPRRRPDPSSRARRARAPAGGAGPAGTSRGWRCRGTTNSWRRGRSPEARGSADRAACAGSRSAASPSDDASLDVDFPAAGTRAVHAVGGSHDFVVLPALAVSLFPAAVLVGDDPVLAREGPDVLAEEGEPIQEVTHGCASLVSASRRWGATAISTVPETGTSARRRA